MLRRAELHHAEPCVVLTSYGSRLLLPVLLQLQLLTI
jgi:hypothetical protein